LHLSSTYPCVGRPIADISQTGEKLKEYELEDDRPNARGGGPQLCAKAWREDGAQLAVGTLNKVVMTVHLGDLVQPKKEEE
jgi:transducin (beta)-like 1